MTRLEQTFLFLAVLVMLFGAATSMAIVAPIFEGPFNDRERLELGSRAFLFFGSITTVLTVLWRGSIASRQARAQVESTKNQTEQIALTREQLALTLESNHAKLIKDGLELIKDNDTEMQDAGLAIISTIAASRDRKHATLVMDILADRLIPRLATEDLLGKPSTLALVQMLETAAKVDNSSSRTAAISVSVFLPYLVSGLRQIVYRSPNFGGIRIPSRDVKIGAQRFVQCTIEGCHIVQQKSDYAKGVFFDQTQFICCEFTAIDTEQLRANHFKNCCFSDTVFFGDADIPDLRQSGNYFDPGHPPRLAAPRIQTVDWTAKLHAGDPNALVGPRLRENPYTAHIFP